MDELGGMPVMCCMIKRHTMAKNQHQGRYGELDMPDTSPWGTPHCPHLYCIQLNFFMLLETELRQPKQQLPPKLSYLWGWLCFPGGERVHSTVGNNHVENTSSNWEQWTDEENPYSKKSHLANSLIIPLFTFIWPIISQVMTWIQVLTHECMDLPISILQNT